MLEAAQWMQETVAVLDTLVKRIAALVENASFVQVPKQFYPILAGAGRSALADIRTRYGVSVSSSDSIIEGCKEIVISGETRLQVSQATTLLKERLAVIVTQTQKLAVPQHLSGALLGSKGTTIKLVTEQTGVFVYTSNLQDNKGNLTMFIYGDSTDLTNKALADVQKRLVNLQGAYKTLDFPSKYFKFLYGRNRRNINMIENKTGVVILMHSTTDSMENQYLSVHHTDINTINQALVLLTKQLQNISLQYKPLEVPNEIAPVLLKCCKVLGERFPNVNLSLALGQPTEEYNSLPLSSSLTVYSSNQVEREEVVSIIDRVVRILQENHRVMAISSALVFPLKGLDNAYLDDLSKNAKVEITFSRLSTRKGEQSLIITPLIDVVLAAVAMPDCGVIALARGSLAHTEDTLKARVKTLKDECQPVYVPGGFVPFLIGHHDARIRRIQASTGTTISISNKPKDDKGNHMLIIFGTAKKVQDAFTKVSKYLNVYYQRQV
ncbi:hypothetical protein BABINDRAFT_8621 [Babjeviella inositovora NRRL Y-12698]|uniref:K Homology domain-containing protein n=1 Tax=Babjeviella inositovora NRRL Y-12698 TaxID=984486 RepID=A0A1E3QMV5_9ASCO|nr:uncharacterized protein BABINDRAFT_8621 [Babjeviella inositovora NRRL Y-12698]ODQ79001.1 hypothetical protein BABINDRAFT_8621 [Babjeviella inositovora NRRL Y-12698]